MGQGRKEGRLADKEDEREAECTDESGKESCSMMVQQFFGNKGRSKIG